MNNSNATTRIKDITIVKQGLINKNKKDSSEKKTLFLSDSI